MKNQLYYSTNRQAEGTSFSEALLKGLAPDGGLYMPGSFPIVGIEELATYHEKEYAEIAYSVLNRLIGDEVGSGDLRDLCHDAYQFDVPVEKVEKNRYILRLDRGPTASFKDFAARMMSRLMQHFLNKTGRHLTILTATSGDTGSAVANAFYRLKNINVIILYPEGEVSPMQRKQMTTLDENIQIISLKGKFDDCQRLVKMAFTDSSLARIPLSSANSINIGRLLPQSVYYFYAWSRIAGHPEEKVIFSVPSGNFGNLMGGLIARRMGLPVERFIVATNENDEVPEFIRTGIYRAIEPSLNCISSAMNVGHPSNLSRIVALYGGIMDASGKIHREPDMKSLRNDLYGVSVTDDETRITISDVHKRYGILLEPHGAVAWKGLNEYLSVPENLRSEKTGAFCLETAHPAKFPEEIKKITGADPPLPGSLEGLIGKTEKYIQMENDYDLLKEHILKYY